MKPKILLSWSSGKDSAWTLHVLRQRNDVEVVGLLTTLNSQFDRVAMHGTRHELLKAQAEAAGLPLWEVPLPWPCSNDQYEQAMSGACQAAIQQGISIIAFGDLFLEDVRRYRVDRLRGTGLEPIFPIWGRNTRELIAEMLDSGLRARIVCLDPAKMSAEFIGRDLDTGLLAQLPPATDPCGENGEFHTFAYAGPMFSHAIPIETGESVARERFVFADILLSSENTSAEKAQCA
ncbi:MAG TPA: ATP-binding protein [Candidatus Sulfotelmatobacter sp.]|nr:ATP-binding protein [Candidatus Sulfotelmatobacter sp.]